MDINQYFDETKIIKKKPKEQTQQPTENIEINNEPTEVKTIEENFSSEPVIEMFEISEDTNKKAKQYIETIKDFQQDKKEKPIYNISRDDQKNVIITPKKSSKEVVEVKEEQQESNIDIFYEQYLKVKDENEKKLQYTRVEIMIHNNLIKKEGNPDKRKLYESRLNNLMNDLQLLNKRKSILEDDTLWQKD